MRLLYVEDNRINALLFEQMLGGQAGIELRIAEDGAEALELAGRWLPEVIVLDAHLPDTSGYELLPRLRALPGLAATPAFMCSANPVGEDGDRAAEAGFEGYWEKPVTVSRVLHDLTTVTRTGGAAP
jgi:CheY-like chemotaxis protein